MRIQCLTLSCLESHENNDYKLFPLQQHVPVYFQVMEPCEVILIMLIPENPVFCLLLCLKLTKIKKLKVKPTIVDTQYHGAFMYFFRSARRSAQALPYRLQHLARKFQDVTE